MGFFSELKEDISSAVSDVNEENEVKKDNDEIDLDSLLEEVEDMAPVVSSYIAPQSTHATDENAVITAGMTITGNVDSSGSLEVLGNIKGDITISGKLCVVGSVEGNSKANEIYAENAKIIGEINSSSAIKIGQCSVVIGNLYGTSAVIAGAVKGDIDIKGPVILDTSAIVMGNIKSKSVQINNGAVIEGVCSQCYADVSPTTFFDEFKKKK